MTSVARVVTERAGARALDSRDLKLMDVEARRELKVLEAIAANDRTTQRGLASHVGIAVGLTNLYLKRLIRKGYVKCVNVQSNRVRYLITPKGIAQKTRLTYEFMEYSLRVFREGRNHLKTMLLPLAVQPDVRIAIYGTGEPAELAYLCLRELGLNPAAVFDGAGEGMFFGTPVRTASQCSDSLFDVLIVATFTDASVLVDDLVLHGVAPEKIVTLYEPATNRSLAARTVRLA